MCGCIRGRGVRMLGVIRRITRLQIILICILLHMGVSSALCFWGVRGADRAVGGWVCRSKCDSMELSVAEEPIGGFCFVLGGEWVLMFFGFVVQRWVLMYSRHWLSSHSSTSLYTDILTHHGTENSSSHSFICAGQTVHCHSLSVSIAPYL